MNKSYDLRNGDCLEVMKENIQKKNFGRLKMTYQDEHVMEIKNNLYKYYKHA